MQNIHSFDATEISTLRAFLDSPDRSPESMGYCEAAGFLFVVACAPELVQPPAWVPVIIDPDNAPKANLQEMQAIMGGLISLYNEMNRQVQEEDVALPPKCEFLEDPIANLDSDTSVSQWCKGFRTGYQWLEEMWTDYTPDEMKQEFAAQVMVLCFFASRDLAKDLFDNLEKDDDITIESMAENMKRLFPDAMAGMALMGKSIQGVLAARGENAQPPVSHGGKTGRNDPCTCGSGKKYKKCCGRVQQ